MRHIIHRLLIGGLLGAVTLTSSGCLVTLLLSTVVLQPGEELDLAIGNVSGNSVTALCAPGEGGAVECSYRRR